MQKFICLAHRKERGSKNEKTNFINGTNTNNGSNDAGWLWIQQLRYKDI